jgi:hypothetical protein
MRGQAGSGASQENTKTGVVNAAENVDPVPRRCRRMARQACGSGLMIGKPATSELSQSTGRQMTQAVAGGRESRE